MNGREAAVPGASARRRGLQNLYALASGQPCANQSRACRRWIGKLKETEGQCRARQKTERLASQSEAGCSVPGCA